jgi:hypothetical protein
MKQKINRIIEQRANLSTCKYFAILFLLSRYQGKPFKDCTGYKDVIYGEKEANELKNKLKKFGYI